MDDGTEVLSCERVAESAGDEGMDGFVVAYVIDFGACLLEGFAEDGGEERAEGGVWAEGGG